MCISPCWVSYCKVKELNKLVYQLCSSLTNPFNAVKSVHATQVPKIVSNFSSIKYNNFHLSNLIIHMYSRHQNKRDSFHTVVLYNCSYKSAIKRHSVKRTTGFIRPYHFIKTVCNFYLLHYPYVN